MRKEVKTIMTDFESLIKDAMNYGTSAEELANAFTKALNAVTAERNEADEREEFYDKMCDTSMNGDPIEEAAAGITMDAMIVYEDWTAEDAESFYKIMLNINTYAAKLWNAVITADGEIQMYANLLPVLSEIEGAINKRKKTDTPRAAAKPIGSSKFKLDDDVIKDFLKSL